jgi:hypothetical protein
MHEQESRRVTVGSSVVLALLTSFIIVTMISPLLRWILSPNTDALIALSVLAAFPCSALLALGMTQVRQTVASRGEGSSGRRGWF